jgi:hypothetical protein
MAPKYVQLDSRSVHARRAVGAVKQGIGSRAGDGDGSVKGWAILW